MLDDQRHDWRGEAGGIVFACGFVGEAKSFQGRDAGLAGWLAPRFDAWLLAFFRFASGSLYAMALWAWHRSPMPRRAEWRWHALRVVLLLVSLVGYFHSLTLLPLAQAVAMSYLSPLFTSLLEMATLGERPSRWIWLSMASIWKTAGRCGMGISCSAMESMLRRRYGRFWNF